MSPADELERARFEAIGRAVEKAGFASPVVVGASPASLGPLSALLATHDGKGVLVVASTPHGSESVAPVEVETGSTPAELGVRGVRFERFLDGADLVDVVVEHTPFQLESSHQFDRHHVVRTRGGALTLACDLDDDDTSSYAKGPRSVTSRRTVTVSRVPGAAPLQFDVKTVSATEERTAEAPPVVTDRTESSTRYELPPSGTCRALPR